MAGAGAAEQAFLCWWSRGTGPAPSLLPRSQQLYLYPASTQRSQLSPWPILGAPLGSFQLGKKKSKTQLCRVVEEQLLCLRAVGLLVPQLWLWVALHLKNASAPQYLWPREDALEEDLPGQAPQLRKGYGSGAAGTAFPPTVGLADPLAWSSTWGSSWEPQSPAFCTGERPSPPSCKQLLPCCPELFRRAGHAAGRLIKALGWRKGSCLFQLPRQRMAAGINASSPLASPVRRRKGKSAACLGVLN